MSGPSSSASALGREFGFQFLVALCDAIEAAVETALAREPDAFSYRRVTLRRAVERELFIALANDGPLYRSFVAKQMGESSIGYRHRDALTLQVARELLGPDASIGSSAAVKARAALPAVRRWLTRSPVHRQGDRPAAGDASEVVFVLNHEKFFAFLQPVIEALGPELVSIIVTRDPAPERVRDSGLRYRSVAQVERRAQPLERSMGRLLRARPYLAVQFDQLHETVLDLGPKCVVVAEGNSPHDELANQVAHSLGIPSVCVQHGWSPIVHTGFRHMAFDTMAVWGEGFAELLSPWNMDQRFEAVGSPMFAQRRHPERLRESQRPVVAFFGQCTSPLISADGLARFDELIIQSSEKLTDATILLRPHPAQGDQENAHALSRRANVKLVPHEQFDLREVIEAADVVVSIYSTTLLEAAALRKPVLAMNVTSMPRYFPDLEELGIGVETRTVEQTLRALRTLVEDSARRASFEPAQEHFRQRFFEDGANDAPRRLTRLIERVARESTD